MSAVMKERHLRPSCVNRIPTLSPPPATNAVAAKLSSGLALIRHRYSTMRTRVQPIGEGSSAWNLRALWVSLRSLVERGKSDCHTATSRGRAGVLPTIALRPTVTLLPEEQRLSPSRIDGGHVLRSTPVRHLWLVLRSEEHRRGAFWETVGFLAIWLSGLIGIAMCVL